MFSNKFLKSQYAFPICLKNIRDLGDWDWGNREKRIGIIFISWGWPASKIKIWKILHTFVFYTKILLISYPFMQDIFKSKKMTCEKILFWNKNHIQTMFFVALGCSYEEKSVQVCYISMQTVHGWFLDKWKIWGGQIEMNACQKMTEFVWIWDEEIRDRQAGMRD